MSFSLFTDPEESFKVDFVVAKHRTDANTLFAAGTEEDLRLLYENADLETLQKQSATFRYPDFADTSSILDDSISMLGKTPEIHFHKLKMERMIRLIKTWTLGVLPTRENIEKLNPAVAMVIGNEMDKYTS